MDYRLDSHTHTIASGHAYNTIQEMADAAARAGLDLLAITEHAMALPGTCHELYFMNLKVVPRRLCGVDVLFGAEVNIMDYQGTVDMKPSLLHRMDVCVASMHTLCIEPGTMAQNTNAYLGAMDCPDIQIIGHPDDGRFPVDFDTLAAAAAQKNVLLELNNHSQAPDSSRLNARENALKLLEACKKYKTRIILNSDAHWCGDVGNWSLTGPLLELTRFPEELVINQDVSAYRALLEKRKTSLQ